MDPMTKANSLEELEKSLGQSNKALQKRALAIIHNEVVVEAQGILQRFIGTGPEPDLLALALKVQKKLQEFSGKSDQLTTESLIPLLQSDEESRRMYALRALRQRRSPNVAYILQQFGADFQTSEAKALVAEALRNNPDIGNLSILLRLIEDPAVNVRLEAYQSIIALISGCILPPLIKGLKDPVPEVVYLVRQFLKQVRREELLAALRLMLTGDQPPVARLAASVLGGLSGQDVLPLLKANLNHPDPETATLIRSAVAQMAVQGDREAATLVAQPATLDPNAGSALREIEAKLREVWPNAPAWLLDPLTLGRGGLGVADLNARLRSIFERIGDLLAGSFVCAYFTVGTRNKVADRTCFRAAGLPAGPNTLPLLRLLSETLPDPYGFGDLFPLSMGYCFREGLDDEFTEPFLSLQEGFNLLEEYPEEAANFHAAAVEGLRDLLRGLAKFLGSNHLVALQTTPEGPRIYDLWRPSPLVLDSKLFGNVSLRVNAPVLVSQDSLHHLLLTPFFLVDPANGRLWRCPFDDKAKWEFYDRVFAKDAFLQFLNESGS